MTNSTNTDRQAVSVQQIKAQYQLIVLTEKQADIRWIDKQGSIRTGTLRRINTPQDLIGAEVSITLHPGTQVGMAFTDMAALIHDGRLAEQVKQNTSIQPAKVVRETIQNQQPQRIGM